MDAFDWIRWIDTPEFVDWSTTVDPMGYGGEASERAAARVPHLDPAQFTATHLLTAAASFDEEVPSCGYAEIGWDIKDIIRTIYTTWPREDQVRLYCELAAKYLPRIAAHFRHAESPCSAYATLMTAIVSMPESRALFFVFMSHPANATLVARQGSRLAQLGPVVHDSSAAQTSELQQMCYLMFHLLVGTGGTRALHSSGPGETHKSYLSKLLLRIPPSGAGLGGREQSDDAITRTVRALEIEQVFFAQWRGMQRWLHKCRRSGCDVRVPPGYGAQCARCGFVRYCRLQHLEEDARRHWHECFRPDF